MILAVTALGLRIIARWDRPLGLKGRWWLWIVAGAAAEAGCIAKLCVRRCSVGEWLMWGIMGGSLLLACVTDRLLRQVYNFTWWIFLAALALLWGMGGGSPRPLQGSYMDCESLGWVMVYLGLQLLFAGCVYGRADSYAFCVCALAQTLLGISVAGFLVHMSIAYVLLFVIQLARRNIDRRGNLRKPVPFLPYITAAFWATVTLHGLFI